jgi:hypothetical protein
MDLPSELRVLLARIHALEVNLTALDDRIRVLEEQTVHHESRLDDLENGGEVDAYLSGD